MQLYRDLGLTAEFSYYISSLHLNLEAQNRDRVYCQGCINMQHPCECAVIPAIQKYICYYLQLQKSNCLTKKKSS